MSGYTGQTGFTLWLYLSDSLVNTGGDSLTETADSRGAFVASVDESLNGIYDVVVTNSGGAVVFDFPQGLDTDVSNRVGDSPSRSLLSTISSAVTSIATTVATVSGLATAIKAVTDLFTFTGNDVHATLDGETVSGGGLTDEQAAQLTAIEAQAALITTGRIYTVSNVDSSGRLHLYLGDDHVADNTNTLNVTVTDADESLKDYLSAAASIIFGAGTAEAANQITGTVTPANVTASGGITTIPVIVTAAGSAAATPGDDYTFHIKAIDGSGNEATKVEGSLTVHAERAQV
jgi:hypothetical protein